MRFLDFLKKYQKYIYLYGGITLVLIAVILIVVFTKPGDKNSISSDNFKMDNVNENIGEQVSDVEKKNMFAPYVDMVGWVDLSNDYSVNGAPNLQMLADSAKVSVFHLGFINPDQTNPFDDAGTIRWGWGGYYDLSENGNDGYQYEGIKTSIWSLKDNGGDVIVSFGGQLGVSPWSIGATVDQLSEMYIDVINTYDLSRIDLDIEMSNQGALQNQINAKAIKKVQDETGVLVSLTIPIMPSGWSATQLNVIDAYLEEGVELCLVNSMTMCYGDGVWVSEDYGDASIRAIENASEQLVDIYKKHGIVLTKEEAYQKMGTTVAIGFESYLYPTFTIEMIDKVAKDAINKGLGLMSFWSISRDAGIEQNTGISGIFEYTNTVHDYY